MALRTIEAPGVEIKEIDKSGYSPAMTGTRCYVMGYSDKGTPYEPMQFTSKAAWQNYYGEPDNEAERYFYNACSEVINQNGVLYCARLPYENKAKDKMVGFKFKVGTNPIDNPRAGDYLMNSEVRSWVDHNTNFEKASLRYVIDNKTLREIDGVLSNGLEHDKEIQMFYDNVIDSFHTSYDSLNSKQRYSTSYYVCDKEESLKLTKRYGTKEEAVKYLEETSSFHGGNYWIQTDYSVSATTQISGTDFQFGPCLVRDRGDWIAQPIYRKYVKEAVVEKEDETMWPGFSLSDVQDEKYAANLKDQIFKNLTATNLSVIRDGLLSDVTEDDTLSDISRTFKDRKAQAAAILSVGEGMKYYDDIIESYDNFLCSKHGVGINKEIVRDGYLCCRVNYLTGRNIGIELKDIDDLFEKVDYGRMISKVLTCNVYEKVSAFCDGADNEYMWNSTTREMYEDKVLGLVRNNSKISDLWETELWEPYRGMRLSSILRVDSKCDANNITSWSDMLSTYKNEGGITYKQLYTDVSSGGFDVTFQRIKDDVPYHSVVDVDQRFNKYLQIDRSLMPITCDLTSVDEYRTGESTVAANTFWVFDKTCATLNSIPEDSRKGKDRECIGIFPVITTAANAMYAQSLIDVADDEIIHYETISGTRTKCYGDTADVNDCNELLVKDVSMRFSQNDRTEDETTAIDTVSRDANGYFLPIQMNSEGNGFDTENTKKIGVVVYKAYLDASEGNKVSFSPVESFVGSLDKNAKNPNTGVSTFIDKVVNTQSEYIYFFSNCFCNDTTRKTYENDVDFFVCKSGVNGMLGWFGDETAEEISYPTLLQSIDKCFKKVEDINKRDIDIVCDAGLANIAQYLKSVYGGSGAHAYDLAATDDNGNPLIKTWKASDVNAWKTVQFRYDNFCKNVRKDCMFIADGPRPLVLQGEKKIIRSSKPSNTIDANILPNVKYCTGLNTNYGAGYMDWFLVTDEFTGDEFWCPPSIKAMGVYVNTDLNFDYWMAPAGLNRGVVQALDCAFSPTVKQAGPIYQKNWNYAVNYPNDGIVLEGQKTFQTKPSSLDRVSARRTMLRLERQTGKVLKYFKYEKNNSYTRQRIIDMLNPYFYQAKVGGGLYDYKLICDESNNDIFAIDNNELHVSVGLKLAKDAEFIIVTFIPLSTGANWNEMT